MNNSYDEDDSKPTGTLGRLGGAKIVAWVVIIGLVALSIGAASFLFAVGL
jgi:hypothetical protein